MNEPDRDTQWARWHEGYADPHSTISRRLQAVRMRLREVLTAVVPGPVSLISICAGQAHDVVGALRGHARRDDVSGLLVESDPFNVQVARQSLTSSGLTNIEVVQADASRLDVYRFAVPADVLLLCGIFGNVSDADIHNTIDNASRLCAPDAYVIWTRHQRPPDLTPQARQWFMESGFEEHVFDTPSDKAFGVGTNKLATTPKPFEPGLRLFTFG